MKRRAIIRVSHGLLEELLRIPKGIKIERVTQSWDNEACGTFKVMLSARDNDTRLPAVAEGRVIPECPVEVTDDGVIHIRISD